MEKKDNAINLFPCKDYTFCRNLACKSYNNCVRASSNYKFDKYEYISVFSFGTPNNYKEINKCNNFIEKKYK